MTQKHRFTKILSIHLKETRIERDTYTLMFTKALFTIPRTWKQPRCPSADEWISKLWYIYTMEYYSAIKRECIWVSSNEVDETGAYYTEWSKSERETPTQYINAYIWNLDGEGNGTPLQYSCLENPREGGAWWAAVYGVAQSWTRLKWLSSMEFRKMVTTTLYARHQKTQI